jgi:hypothetical protein
MINEIEIQSRSRANLTHTLFLDEKGKAVGCTCEYRQYHTWTPCPHMTEWNTQLESITTTEIVPHVEDELRNSCCVCGRETRNIICYRCIV